MTDTTDHQQGQLDVDAEREYVERLAAEGKITSAEAEALGAQLGDAARRQVTDRVADREAGL